MRTDRRPATDDRPTTSHLENFKWPYLREGSSDPFHVWFYGGVFEVGGSNGAISGFAKSKMAAQPPSWNIQTATSPRRIVPFTPCLVLGWGFRGRRIEWRYFRFRQMQAPPSWKIQMAISPLRIVRFTPCLVLIWVFRVRRILIPV